MSTISAATSPGMGRMMLASAIGTSLEWYDFTIYNLMAALVFNAVFFPAFDPLTGTVLAFSTYAVGYVSRPLGGFVFGRLGDQIGRKRVLMATLVLMGAASGLIGVLPMYRTLGIWSPLLLVSLRFLQGAAIGGEWAGAVLLALEHGAPERRGLHGSYAQVGPSCGTLLGTACIAGLTLSLSPGQFETWGWRIPFLLSLALVAFGTWIRLGVDETPVFEELERRHEKSQAPLREVFRIHWRRLLIAAGVRVGSDVLYALVVVFTLTYVTTVLELPRSLALTATMLGAILNFLTVPLFGALSDRCGRRPVYIAGALLGVVWSFVFFVLLAGARPFTICLAVVVGLLVHAMMFGPQAAFVTEQFPARVRYAGASLAYTLAGIVGGGFAPLIITSLYRAYGATVPVSIYVSCALLVTLAALACARETAQTGLEK